MRTKKDHRTENEGLKIQDQISRVENAGPENAFSGPAFSGPPFSAPRIDLYSWLRTLLIYLHEDSYPSRN